MVTLRDDLFTVGLCMFWFEADRLEEVLACYWARKVFFKGHDTAGNHLARIVRTLVRVLHPDKKIIQDQDYASLITGSLVSSRDK